jgi:mRNA interferase RelE/StbE
VRTAFLASFLRDVERLRDAQVRARVARAIEAVEAADGLADLVQFKWLSGYPGFGRIRAGDWRLGVTVSGDLVTFVLCLHRREVYRYFP